MKIDLVDVVRAAGKRGIMKIPKPTYPTEKLSSLAIDFMESEREGWNKAIVHFEKMLDDLRGIKNGREKYNPLYQNMPCDCICKKTEQQQIIDKLSKKRK